MLEKLKKHWKVNGVDLLLIIATFAIGGSLCGYAGRKILLFSGFDKGALWIFLYIILVTILWPLAVLLISIPLGQFAFFKTYVARVGKKLFNRKRQVRLAIFASGTGTNAQQIINHFKSSSTTNIALIACNKRGAGVLSIAEKEHIPVLLLEKERFFNGDAWLAELKEKKIDMLILAGFLWKIPTTLINAYPKKIINIHPALLPSYGGKGMYGEIVHESVIRNKEKESGITIHYVDELYDHGAIIFQEKCVVAPGETAASLAEKIHVLEHKHYPEVIKKIIEG